jgi:hypothetical protein
MNINVLFFSKIENRKAKQFLSEGVLVLAGGGRI